jgi:N-carbamoyl-L-amino-acid hydrolase
MDAARLETQLGRQRGDLRFYLSGSAQARLLDWLDPEWKREFPLADLYLEDALRAVLLRQARVKPERLLSVLEELGEIGKTPDGGVGRVAFSEADLKGRAFFMSRMEEAGLAVRIDAAGNIVGRRAGTVEGLPPIVIGSHLDSVPNGGRYDGALGAAVGLECAAVLKEAGALLRHPLEVIIFTDEEGGLIGSKALVGELEAKTLEIIARAVSPYGRDRRGRRRSVASRRSREEKGDSSPPTLEIHIEQGGVLDGKGIPIGVVEGIVGIARWEVAIEGFANHAGTTPMDQRHDALLAAAHLIAAVNRVVTERPGRQVGTVGRIRAEPGAVNVIPGRVEMSVELRDLDAEKIQRIFGRIREEAVRIAARTGTKIGFAAVEDRTALTDDRLRAVIESAKLASSDASGVGHDAQSMPDRPTGMIALSAGGSAIRPRVLPAWASKTVLRASDTLKSTDLRESGRSPRWLKSRSLSMVYNNINIFNIYIDFINFYILLRI